MDELKKTHDMQELPADVRKPLGVFTSEGVVGLPVAGYKPTQSPEAIAVVNRFKALEEQVLREIDNLSDRRDGSTTSTMNGDFCDQRLLAVGRTQLQGAFMFLARSIFQPGRVELPEDFHAYAGHEQLNVAKD